LPRAYQFCNSRFCNIQQFTLSFAVSLSLAVAAPACLGSRRVMSVNSACRIWRRQQSQSVGARQQAKRWRSALPYLAFQVISAIYKPFNARRDL